MSAAPEQGTRDPDGKLHGHGGDFHKACDSAWLARQPHDPTDYVVEETSVTGTNPITGYGVVLRPK